MKNKVFYYLVAFMMIFGAKTTAEALIIEDKNLNIKGTTKAEDIIMPIPNEDELAKSTLGKRPKDSKSYKRPDVLRAYDSSNGKVSSNGRSLHK